VNAAVTIETHYRGVLTNRDWENPELSLDAEDVEQGNRAKESLHDEERWNVL
jgi:hypothetical protein